MAVFEVSLARYAKQIAAALLDVIEVEQPALHRRHDRQQSAFALKQRQGCQIVALDGERVEGVEERPLPPKQQLVEVRRPSGSRQQTSPSSTA